ncbi:MAG: dephospho-CoA kinase [Gammaproteobacteria bacterium]|nr:dephospho-CoA kinase [Gammaproteobacteria bacterium]
MLVIGLTGGIGVGKTTVANLFAKHGVPIIDADEIAKNLTQPGTQVFAAIQDHFQKENIIQAGQLNRSQLRQLIFADAKERLWLENLLHPLILAEILAQIKQLKTPYCIAVIPLLIEVNSYPFINRILVVDAPLALQKTRVQLRDHHHSAAVEAILNAQLSQSKRLEKADDVIYNRGELTELIPQVEKLDHFYRELCKLG